MNHTKPASSETSTDWSSQGSRALHATLLIAGSCYFAAILGWGRANFYAYDWPIWVQYLRVLKDAVAQGVIPYHAYMFPEMLSGPNAMQTEYLAAAHTVIAPHVILGLRFFEIPTVTVGHIVLNFVAGYYGLYRLCRQNDLDRLSFSMCALIFFGGGFLAARIVSGQPQDISYMLMPLALAFAQQLAADPLGVRYSATARLNAVMLSLVLVYTALQGSLHVLHIDLLLLGIAFIWSRRAAESFAFVVGLVVWGAAVRLVPTYLFIQKYLVKGSRQILGGYGYYLEKGQELCSRDSMSCWFSELARAAAVLTPIDFPNSFFWEFDIFIGLAGILLLVIGFCQLIRRSNDDRPTIEGLMLLLGLVGFGFLFQWSFWLANLSLVVAAIGHYLSNEGRSDRDRVQRGVVLSSILCFILILGPNYQRFAELADIVRMPHVNNGPSRMAIYVILVWSGVAGYGWQLARTRAPNGYWYKIAQYVLISLVIGSVADHFSIWNLPYVEYAAAKMRDANALSYFGHYAFKHGILDRAPSASYRWTVLISAAATGSYLIATLLYVLRPGNRRGSLA